MLQAVQRALKKTASFNLQDTWFTLYTIVMLFALLTPTLFVTNLAGSYRSAAIVYVLTFLYFQVTDPAPSLNRDISQNIKRYSIIAISVFAIFTLLLTENTALANATPFTNAWTKLLWFVFAVGVSESVIRRGLQNKLGNPIATSIIMGLLHITAYQGIQGTLTIGPEFIINIVVSMVAFYIFYLVYEASGRDIATESIVHGLYDFVLLGGFTIGGLL
jgi:hypothetical protein